MVVTGELTALEAAYRTVYVGALIFLALMIFLCLIRAVKGPSIADRIVAVNMMGTMVMVIIAILALMLKEGYLVDICLIYAMISFLGVVVLCKIYTGVYLQKKGRKATLEAVMENIRIQQQNNCACQHDDNTRQHDDNTRQQGSSDSSAIAASTQNQSEKEGE